MPQHRLHEKRYSISAAGLQGRHRRPCSAHPMYPSTSPASCNNSMQDPRPVRLRAACNPCHNAKIRCSGERDGCTRCRNLNHVHACKYSISWVGRASVKNKRARSPEETESTGKLSRSSSTGASRAPTWEPDVILGKNCNIQDLFDDQSMDWPTLDRQPRDFDSSNVGQSKPASFDWQLPPASKSCGSPLPSPQEFGRGMIPFVFESQGTVPKAACSQSENIQLLLETPRPPSTQQQEQQQKLRLLDSQSHYFESIGSKNPSAQPSLSSSHSIASKNSTNSSNSNADQCISLCTQIISHLDSQISDSSLGLDGVLQISKSCTSVLLHITSLESCKVNPNCLLLLCVAVNQMSTLFENNIPAMNSLPNSLSISTLPSLLFGSFQVDHEDQLAVCTRLFCREIQRCRQLLDRISGMHQHHQQQSQKPNNTANSTANLLQKQWFLASAGRLDSLVAAVTV